MCTVFKGAISGLKIKNKPQKAAIKAPIEHYVVFLYKHT